MGFIFSSCFLGFWLIQGYETRVGEKGEGKTTKLCFEKQDPRFGEVLSLLRLLCLCVCLYFWVSCVFVFVSVSVLADICWNLAMVLFLRECMTKKHATYTSPWHVWHSTWFSWVGLEFVILYLGFTKRVFSKRWCFPICHQQNTRIY